VHLVVACHRYYPVPGGSERIAQLVAEGAVRRGDRATVITQAEPGLAADEELNGVTVRRLPMRRRAGIRIPRGYLRALRATRGDVFHLHGNRIWCADFYLPFAGMFGWPQLGTGHGFYQYTVDPKPWDRWYFERYFPRVLRGLDLYVCDTEFERRQLVGWGFPPERLARIPLGSAWDEFQTASVPSVRAGWGLTAPRVAVYVGGFFENKRVDRLIDAVAATRGGWALVAIGRDVAGSRYDRSTCERRAAERGVEFRATGPIPRPEVIAALRSCDAVVSGSEYEGFGVTIAEALAAGKPFVAFPAGAAPEMAEGGAGRIVQTVEEFGQALVELENDELRRTMAERAKAAGPEWTESTMVERYLAAYDRLRSTVG
jgi:glycosyltransferase involved in cell wall biosynthesis